MNKKILKFETNFNHKLSCDRFLHISLAPASKPNMEELQKIIFEIHVADKSHPPVAVNLQLFTSCRLGLISNYETWASHGMTTTEFINWLFKKHPEINKDSDIGIYFYSKLPAA